MRVAAVDSALKELLERCAPDIGDRLPAERDIAAQIGCSRQTIRIAFAKMEHAGLIWRHVGKGTFRGPAPLDVPLRKTLLIAGATPTHLIRTRLLLEPFIAGEAARRVDATGIQFLQRKVEAGRRCSSRADSEQADSHFHHAIAQITGNPVLIGLMGYLSSARRQATWQRAWDRSYRTMAPTEFQEAHSDEHQLIVDAITRRDPQSASAAMTRHLETIADAFIGKAKTV